MVKKIFKNFFNCLLRQLQMVTMNSVLAEKDSWKEGKIETGKRSIEILGLVLGRSLGEKGYAI